MGKSCYVDSQGVCDIAGHFHGEAVDHPAVSATDFRVLKRKKWMIAASTAHSIALVLPASVNFRYYADNT